MPKKDGALELIIESKGRIILKQEGVYCITSIQEEH